MAIEIVSFPIKKMVIFQFVFCMFTRPGKSTSFRGIIHGLLGRSGGTPQTQMHPRYKGDSPNWTDLRSTGAEMHARCYGDKSRRTKKGAYLVCLRHVVHKWILQVTWLCQNSYWKWPLIVDLPMKNGNFPLLC